MADRQEDREHLAKQLAYARDDLGNLADAISHNMQAPLRGIRTMAQWLAAECGEDLSEQGREYLQIITGRVDLMARLIQGVLAFSRVGRLHEEPVKVDLNKLIADIEESLAIPSDLMISIENELPYLWFEPTCVYQIFLNLLSNAVRFMDKSPGFIKVACQEQADTWTFSVSDNGPGIAPKHRERIFQLFCMLHSRERHENAGVGLTIVKKIVDLYGGRIWVESEVGKGSTFFFTLPKTMYRCHPSSSDADTTAV